MFKKLFRCMLTVSAIAVGLSACSKTDEPFRKEAFPVTGVLTVDGTAPKSPVKVTCHNLGEMDKEHPTFSACMSADEGRFALSTYEAGDGVPAGKYALTFFIGKWNAISASYGGPDQLKGRYTDPKTSEVVFEVDGTGPVDLGTIALKTK